MKNRNLKKGAISNVLTFIVLLPVVFVLLNFLGITGLSAAGITSALAVLGSIFGTGMVGGIIVLMVVAITVKAVLSALVSLFDAKIDQRQEKT